MSLKVAFHVGRYQANQFPVTRERELALLSGKSASCLLSPKGTLEALRIGSTPPVSGLPSGKIHTIQPSNILFPRKNFPLLFL